MLYLVDASFFVFRAWFSMPYDMLDRDGNMTNALYGFTRFLGDFLERTKPEYVAVAFDTALETCFRNEIYPAYKANREPAPDELKQQFDRCREVTRALGLQEFAESRYEADDIIGTLVHRVRADGMNSTILSRDKDLTQLLGRGDVLWDFVGNQPTAHTDVPDKFGVRADQMIDFLALAGDSVDNIPGVRGVGPKTAVALLNHFDNLDAIYDCLDEVAELAVRGAKTLAAKLEANHESALVSRELAAIKCDIPLTVTHTDLRRTRPDTNALNEFFDRADFGFTLRRQAERIADSF